MADESRPILDQVVKKSSFKSKALSGFPFQGQVPHVHLEKRFSSGWGLSCPAGPSQETQQIPLPLSSGRVHINPPQTRPQGRHPGVDFC